jgi:hypothetical protein
MNVAQLFESINCIKESYFQSQLLVEREKEKHKQIRACLQNTTEGNARISESLCKLYSETEDLKLKIVQEEAFLTERRRVEEALTKRWLDSNSQISHHKQRKHSNRYNNRVVSQTTILGQTSSSFLRKNSIKL